MIAVDPEVLEDLPEKIAQVQGVLLTEAQEKVYDMIYRPLAKECRKSCTTGTRAT